MLSILIFEATAPSIIHQKNFAVQYLTKVTTSVSADDLNDDSSIDDENLQKLIDNPEEIINTQQMTPEELKILRKQQIQSVKKLLLLFLLSVSKKCQELTLLSLV